MYRGSRAAGRKARNSPGLTDRSLSSACDAVIDVVNCPASGKNWPAQILPSRDPVASMDASLLDRPPQPSAHRPPRRAARRPARLAAMIAAAALIVVGCRLTPQTNRDWAPELARSATADFAENRVCVHNVRNSTYRTDTDFDVRFEDRTYDLSKLDSADYILVPLSGMPRIAHTFISFGFHGQDYLAISIEVRRLRGESFKPFYNFLNENEIIYVAGDERDLIRLRSNFRKDDVYVYRAKLSPQQCQGLFVDMLQRANQLSVKPEFYNTLTNNCENNLIAHLNQVLTKKIPNSYEVLFPGLSDRLLFSMGLIEPHGKTFDETRTAARINRMAQSHPNAPDFSQQIRRF